MNIKSYADKETQQFDQTGNVSKACKWRALENIVRRKLDILIYGNEVNDFKVPPGNRFEWLRGDLKGLASIRVNDQWRIVFRISKNNELEDVAVVDYH